MARFERVGRWLPLPLLAASTALVALAVTGGDHEWGRFEFALMVAAAAALWTATVTVRLGPGSTAARRLWAFVVHTALAGVLVWANPWYGVFAVTGYLLADDLALRWRAAGFAVTAGLLAASQSGGYPLGWAQLAVYLVMVAVNLALVLTMAVMTTRVLWQNRERGRMIEALAETNRRLEATMAENAGLHAQLLVQAREAGVLEERRRLAGEIHDTLAQGLAGIVAQLEAAEQARRDEQAWSRHLVRARTLARSCLTEARRSVRALRPEQLEGATLVEAIDRLARTWSAASGVAAELELTGTPSRADARAESALFRAAQEALANVAKHARASTVHITLSFLGDEVLLDVQDDGVGFDPARAAGGYGLVGMRDRLAAVSGLLTVEAAPGSGTTVNAVVPLAAAARSVVRGA